MAPGYRESTESWADTCGTGDWLRPCWRWVTCDQVMDRALNVRSKLPKRLQRG